MNTRPLNEDVQKSVELWWRAEGSESCQWLVMLILMLSWFLAHVQVGTITRAPNSQKHLLPDQEVQCLRTPSTLKALNKYHCLSSLSTSLGFENHGKLLEFWDLVKQARTGSRCSGSPRQILLPTGPLVFSYAMSLYQDAVIQHKSSSF